VANFVAINLKCSEVYTCGIVLFTETLLNAKGNDPYAKCHDTFVCSSFFIPFVCCVIRWNVEVSDFSTAVV